MHSVARIVACVAMVLLGAVAGLCHAQGLSETAERGRGLLTHAPALAPRAPAAVVASPGAPPGRRRPPARRRPPVQPPVQSDAAEPDLAQRKAAADALSARGEQAYKARDWAAARDAWEAARPRYHTLGARLEEAHTLFNLGQVYYARAEFDTAQSRFAQARDLYHDLAESRHEAKTLTQLGFIADALRQPAPAQAQLEAALVLYEGLGDRQAQANTLWHLSLATLGLLESSEKIFQPVSPSPPVLPACTLPTRDDTLATACAHGDRRAIAWALLEWGQRFQRQRWEEALDDEVRQLFEDALTLFEEVSDSHGAAQAVLQLGQVKRARSKGNSERTLQARETLVEARDRFHALDDRRGEAQALLHLGLGDLPLDLVAVDEN